VKKEANKKYDHREVEKDRYHWWVKNHFFEADLNSRKPGFSIVLPPPNVTGKLHLGHAWDGSLQDAIIRYKKLLGYETLFLPGMDHAGIATQTKVESVLKAEGISRFDLGREKFLKETWKWKKEYAKTIHAQWEKLGLALDYQREKFTLDQDISKLVNYVFVDFYKKGLIYQGKKIVNWDPQQETAISNVEVIYQEVKGKMYYFKYFLLDQKDYLTIATTRPETMFADQAVVVNPKDKRYQKYWNQNVINPINKKLIPIITDDYVEMDFGTGAMKVTPAHDQNDFEIGERHHLAMPLTLNEDGTVNELGGPEFQNLDRFDAREKIVAKAKAEGWLVKEEDLVHQIGFSERSQAVVEPYLSTQWFVKMEPLAKKVLELQKSQDQISFFPERFSEVLLTWMNNIHDWTISRQLWWGHRIPVWYHKETKAVYVNTNPPIDLENWEQDPDVLDTWFSSGLWPFAMLDWKPNEKKSFLFKHFYPNSVLVTGYDIIFFWVARMIIFGLEVVDSKPFNDVLIHGLIRDAKGKKMSKSLGNGIDPMDVIEEYGTDALRFFLLTNSAPGQDIRYSEEKIRDAWNFINKLWNASRFVMMNLEPHFVPWKNFEKELTKHQEHLTDLNKWILTELSKVETIVANLLDKYEFGIIGRELYTFVWSKYCSWFIELSKVELNSEELINKEIIQQVLFYVLKKILILLHPLIPFVTEEIYGKLNLETSILQEKLVVDKFQFTTDYLEVVMEMIHQLREFRLKNNIKKSLELELNLSHLDLTTLTLLSNHQNKINDLLMKLVNSKIVSFNETMKNVSSLPTNNFFIEVDNSKFFDRETELKELKLKLEDLKNELKRSEKILTNKNFLAKAAKDKVNQEEEKFRDYQIQFDLIKEKIKLLEK